MKKLQYKGKEYQITLAEDKYKIYKIGSTEEPMVFSQREYERFESIANSEKQGGYKASIAPLVSFNNDLIKFNPFQYKPSLKLISKENEHQCIYIADEVGVGKTFETGIIISEFLYSGKIEVNDPILIVCPNMLCRKWQEVLHMFFGLSSKIIKDYDEIHGISIISYDSISRSKSQNPSVKMLIVDEAHNANGLRFEKIKSIRNKSSYTVLLSATPLAGKNGDEAKQKELLFGKTINNTDPIFDDSSYYFNRTLKDEMRDENVNFKIQSIPVENNIATQYQTLCRDIFTGSNTIKRFVGLNMIMSSPAAAKAYCENLIKLDNDQIKRLFASSHLNKEVLEEYGFESVDEVYELFDEEDHGSEIIGDYEITDETVESIKGRIQGIETSIESLEQDCKLEELKEIIRKNTEESKTDNPEKDFYKKVIVFTNFNKTAEYLNRNIENSIVINGTISEKEKWKRFEEFEKLENINVLIITNVACEGQDMDFCNTLVNYDLSYNPVQLAQRKGRIDRFEVKKEDLFIYNFSVKGIDPADDEIKKAIEKNEGVKYPNSIYTVLLRKLKIINEQTGIYYNVVDDIGKSTVSINKDAAREKMLNLFNSYFKDKGQYEAIDKYRDIETRYAEINKEKYNLANKFLAEKEVKISENDDGTINIIVEKTNQEILKYIYDGGTLNSHLIYSK